MRIGQGFDAHRLEAGRRLVLGGVEVPHDRGLEGHSDGDVLLHAVANAILGALAEHDIGHLFPSSDPTLEGIDSRVIVARVVELMNERGYTLGNLDATLIAQAPRLSPHQAAIRSSLAELLGAELQDISVKVTSTDHLGALGREEGIASLATVLLRPTRA